MTPTMQREQQERYNRFVDKSVRRRKQKTVKKQRAETMKGQTREDPKEDMKELATHSAQTTEETLCPAFNKQATLTQG